MDQRDKPAGVMFDWDGVLLDSIGASYNVYNKIFEEVGTRQLSMDEYLELQSPNWYEFYAKVGLPTTLWEFVDAEWMRYYSEEKISLHKDATECLRNLKASGFKLALVSNGSKSRVEAEVARFGLTSYFQAIACGETKDELKPNPVLLQRTLHMIGVHPAGAAYVGDSPADIQAAKNAGVTSVGLARGQIQEERLRAESPDYVFGRLGDLVEFLVHIR